MLWGHFAPVLMGAAFLSDPPPPSKLDVSVDICNTTLSEAYFEFGLPFRHHLFPYFAVRRMKCNTWPVSGRSDVGLRHSPEAAQEEGNSYVQLGKRV